MKIFRHCVVEKKEEETDSFGVPSFRYTLAVYGIYLSQLFLYILFYKLVITLKKFYFKITRPCLIYFKDIKNKKERIPSACRVL